jgi:hypothetical protein
VNLRQVYQYGFCLALVGIGIFIVSGCVAVPRSEMMIPASFELNHKHTKSVLITESIGGKEQHIIMPTQNISNKAFTDALVRSLKKSQVFKTIITTGQADYTLDVTILAYSQPWLGVDFDITIKTRWELTDNATHKPAWSDTFETTYKSKMSDALFAGDRLLKANEGAARTNIAEGIKRLSALKM